MISDKPNVISEVEAHLTISHIEMASFLGLPPSLLSKILLSKENITGEEFKCGAQAKKRWNMDEMEKNLLELFQRMRFLFIFIYV
jgi:hypothetical protein